MVFQCCKKAAEINLSGQKLEDKKKKDGFPSFSRENRSTAPNVSELLTCVKWSYCFNKSPALSAKMCRAVIQFNGR